jgi:predicted alpha/beta-fold hydrolase|eukprot:COSAG06_NODE_1045_length_10977_cov_29.037323_3_plen_226_part_00
MGKSAFNDMLTMSCPILTRKYWPSVWMPSARVQHWVYHLLSTLRSAYDDPAAKWTREKLLTKDNHGITIDMLDDARIPETAHIVLIINCSMSGSHAYETFTYAEQMLAKGFRVYALNQRGAANAQLKTAGGVPIAFNTLSGMGDLRETVNWLAKRHKGRRLTLVSFGTASAMLLNYLNTESKRAPVDSAVCISPAMAMESLAEPGFLENRSEAATHTVCLCVLWP